MLFIRIRVDQVLPGDALQVIAESTSDTELLEWRAALASQPPRRSFLLVAGAFGRRFRFGHLLSHLRLDCVKVEAGSPLHRRVIEEGLDFLAHYLLDKHEAPELELEPIEVLLRPVFRPVAGPACAFERVKSQVGDVRDVWMGLFPQPAGGLIDETE